MNSEHASGGAFHCLQMHKAPTGPAILEDRQDLGDFRICRRITPSSASAGSWVSRRSIAVLAPIWPDIETLRRGVELRIDVLIYLMEILHPGSRG